MLYYYNFRPINTILLSMNKNQNEKFNVNSCLKELRFKGLLILFFSESVTTFLYNFKKNAQNCSATTFPNWATFKFPPLFCYFFTPPAKPRVQRKGSASERDLLKLIWNKSENRALLIWPGFTPKSAANWEMSPFLSFLQEENESFSSVSSFLLSW